MLQQHRGQLDLVAKAHLLACRSRPRSGRLALIAERQLKFARNFRPILTQDVETHIPTDRGCRASNHGTHSSLAIRVVGIG